MNPVIEGAVIYDHGRHTVRPVQLKTYRFVWNDGKCRLPGRMTVTAVSIENAVVLWERFIMAGKYPQPKAPTIIESAS